MRSGWIKKSTGQFLDMKGCSSRNNGSKGRRTQDVRCRRTFHKRRNLSIKQGGNTHCHVIASTGEGTGHRSDQLSRHPEIAKFDNSFTGQENV